MKKTKKTFSESIESKCMVFIIAVLSTGVLFGSILSSFKDMNFIAWAVILLGGVLGLAFFVLSALRKYVIEPLRSLETSLTALTSGSFSFPLKRFADDELGGLNRAVNDTARSIGSVFRKMRTELHRASGIAEKVEANFANISESTKHESEAISNIASSLEQMNSASAEISGSAESLAISTEEKAASIEEMVTSIGQVANSAQELSNTVDATSASIIELSASVKEVANKAEDLISASEETLTAAEEISSSIKEVEQRAKESAVLSEKVKNEAASFGMTSVEKTIEGIQNIKASFDKTAGIIKKLGVRSAEIGKILNVIDEITDQTTLLALNAAILAAQAGEHGKGFSVVADEIKDLAERTSFSTREIAELIQSVQQEVKDAIFAMDAGMGSVEEGARVATDAGDALKKIVLSSTQSAEMSLSIERSTTEQARTTKLVSSSMEKVKNMVMQVANATIEQSKGALLITKATEKMRDVANHVKSATNEQLINIKLVYESIELVSEKSRQIAMAVNEQRLGATQIFDSVERIEDIPKNNLNMAAEINQSLETLFGNTEMINRELEGIMPTDQKLFPGTRNAATTAGIEPKEQGHGG
jgi:methyl-accepting chemotaxis protein